jgi:DNA-binding GntR family transcriptional regulator
VPAEDPAPLFDRRRSARPPRRRSTLSQEITDHLRSQILTGELRAGQFIRIDAVAEELDVSNTPVREALVTLQGYGLVDLLPNRGFQVAELSQEDIADAFLVQRFVAGELTARATPRLSDADLDRLDAIQARITRAHDQGDHAAVDAANDEFHRLINLAADAPKLRLFLGMALRYVPHAPETAVAGWQDATATDHSGILRALRERDADAARDAMVAHIDHARSLLIAQRRRQGQP